ncbi:MAG: HD domain-containing protein [Bacillaceae bacterium]|nr:HD domain-containing protein [Bacillaceae bacterium]
MRNVTLLEIYSHPITQKYVKRSGLAHAIATAYNALKLSIKYDVNPDLATKAAFLHDIGHYTWYKDGEWDFQLYKENDIHAIKGAERAHKLLVRLGEDPRKAKQIALAVLLHTDSYLPDGELERNNLQKVVALADEIDEEPNGQHHYRQISNEKALQQIKHLDSLVDAHIAEHLYRKSV